MNNICKFLSTPVLCEVMQYATTSVKQIPANSPMFRYLYKYHDNPESYNELANKGRLNDLKFLSNWATHYTIEGIGMRNRDRKMNKTTDINIKSITSSDDILLFRFVHEQIDWNIIALESYGDIYRSIIRSGAYDLIPVYRKCEGSSLGMPIYLLFLQAALPRHDIHQLYSYLYIRR